MSLTDERGRSRTKASAGCTAQLSCGCCDNQAAAGAAAVAGRETCMHIHCPARCPSSSVSRGRDASEREIHILVGGDGDDRCRCAAGHVSDAPTPRGGARI